MSDKLKPCPFCGGEAMLNYFGSRPISYYQISCSECGCRQASSIHKESVINTWNTRKSIDRIVEQLEEVSFTDIDEQYTDDGQRMLFLYDALQIVKGDDENE